MNKLTFFILLVAIISLIFMLSISNASGNNYKIIGNSVEINDSNIYLSAYPHTIRDYGAQELTLISKQFTGDIDIIFGFNSTQARPKALDLYSPYDYNVTESYTCDHEFNYTSTPKYFWCYYTYQINEGTNSSPVWVNKTQTVFEHSFETGNIPAKTVYWNESIYKDWKPVASSFTKISQEYMGFNLWYVAKKMSVVAGVEYKTRLDLNAQINSNGKYWVCIKPNSQTLSQAISNNNLYCFDPWWNVSFGYRYEIQNTSALSPNVPFSINDSGLVDGTPLWTLYNISGDSNYTYSTVSGPSGILAVAGQNNENCWENASDLTGNCPTGIYPSSIALDVHLDDFTNANDSSSHNHDGTVFQATSTADGRIGNALSFDGAASPNNDYVNFGDEPEFDVAQGSNRTFLIWINSTGDWAGTEAIAGKWEAPGAQRNWLFRIEADGKIRFFGGSGGSTRLNAISANSITNNVWVLVGFRWDGSTDIATIWINDSDDGSTDMTASPPVASTAKLGFGATDGEGSTGSAASYEGWQDEGIWFTRLLTDAEMLQIYWNGIGNLTSFGNEEINISIPINITQQTPANGSNFNQTGETVNVPFSATCTDGTSNCSNATLSIWNSTGDSIIFTDVHNVATINLINGTSYVGDTLDQDDSSYGIATEASGGTTGCLTVEYNFTNTPTIHNHTVIWDGKYFPAGAGHVISFYYQNFVSGDLDFLWNITKSTTDQRFESGIIDSAISVDAGGNFSVWQIHSDGATCIGSHQIQNDLLQLSATDDTKDFVNGVVNFTVPLTASESPYNYTFTANDTANNLVNFSGGNYTFTITAIPPTNPTIILPLDGYSFTAICAIPFKVISNETEIDSWWYSLDNGVTNITFIPNESLSCLADANYTIYVWLNLTNGFNSTQVNVSFEVIYDGLFWEFPTTIQGGTGMQTEIYILFLVIAFLSAYAGIRREEPISMFVSALFFILAAVESIGVTKLSAGAEYSYTYFNYIYMWGGFAIIALVLSIFFVVENKGFKPMGP